MSDYIKREDAIKLKDVCTDTYADKKYFIEQLKAIPSADVEPVRHSVWKEVLAGMDFEYECTRCKACVEQEYPYCPNCGAKMDGGEQEHE